MISMTIGAFVTIGVLNLFNANSDTYNVLQAQARLQESANFGLNVMARDLEKSGYRGCFSSGDVYFTMASEADISPDYDIRYGLSVFNGVDVGNWTTSATTLPTAIFGKLWRCAPLPLRQAYPRAISDICRPPVASVTKDACLPDVKLVPVMGTRLKT